MRKNKPKIEFVSGIKEELKKVTWPSRAETIRLTAVVIFVSLIVALYIGIMDVFLAKGLRILTQFR